MALPSGRMTPEDLRRRHSVRSYSAQELPPEVVDTIRSEITFINTHEAGLRFTLCMNDGEPFRGFRRSYGAFRNVNNYIAVSADAAFPDVCERAGFFGEQLVMLCVRLGLGTCFVSGTYDSGSVRIQPRVGEKILFLITIGYEDESRRDRAMARLMKKAVHLRKMAPEDYLECPGEMRKRLLADRNMHGALQAVACAPSAVNRRPTRISVDNHGRISACVRENRQDLLIDLGIAMYNFSAVYPGTWEWGNPARFIPD